MKTRATVLNETGAPSPYAESQPLTKVELELDAPGPDELLIEVKAAGLCHSDLSVMTGKRPRPLPMAIGHEAAGIVVDTGDNTTGFKAGDHVVLAFVPTCDECEFCLDGRPALYEPGAAANGAGTLLGGHHRLHDNQGQPVNHHLGVSAFSDRIVVSKHSAVKVPDDLEFDIAALFGCAVLTGRGGTTVGAGLAHPEKELNISALSLVAEERTLKGSYLGSCVPSRDIPRFIAMYRKGELPVDRLLSHRLTPDQINEGFDRLASGDAVRQVVIF